MRHLADWLSRCIFHAIKCEMYWIGRILLFLFASLIQPPNSGVQRSLLAVIIYSPESQNGQLSALPLLTSPTFWQLHTPNGPHHVSFLSPICSMNSLGAWASISTKPPCQSATVQFVQRQLFWVCPSRHDSSCSSNYGLHWSKGMGSRWLPSTRVCADGEPKVWHPRYPMPGCGEAKSQSLGEKLWLWCQRWALPGSLSEDLWLVWSPRWCGPLQGVHGLGTVGQWTGCSCGSCQSWRRGQQQSAKLSGPQSSELFRIKSKESCSNHFHHHLFQCRWRPLLSEKWHGQHCSQAGAHGAVSQLRGWVAALS